jgi:hypothetical protein
MGQAVNSTLECGNLFWLDTAEEIFDFCGRAASSVALSNARIG